MSLRSVNLNLIPVLQALLRERSVAATAAALDLSPAATSEALSRLRVVLDDPLLVRVGNHMELTPKAAELVGPVNRLCEDAEGLLQVGERFEPGRSKRQFKIASNDSLVFVTAKRILDAVRLQAPSVQVHFSDPQPEVGAQLASREIDLLLMPRMYTDPMVANGSIRCRTVLRDRMVVVFSDRHPLAHHAELTRDDLAAYPQVLYNPTTAVHEGRRERETMGVAEFNVAMRVAQLAVIPCLVVDPPYIAWTSQAIAERMGAALQLQSRPVPFASPNLDACLAWSPVQDGDPGHRWFRELVAEAVRQD